MTLVLALFTSGHFHLYRSHTFFAPFGFKRDRIAIADFIYQTGYMDENFLAGAILNDETITFGLVVKFNGSLVH